VSCGVLLSADDERLQCSSYHRPRRLRRSLRMSESGHWQNVSVGHTKCLLSVLLHFRCCVDTKSSVPFTKNASSTNAAMDENTEMQL